MSFEFFKNKNFPVQPTSKEDTKKYLSHRHEVMAYAKTIISELQKKLRFDGDVLRFLQQPKPGANALLDKYLQTFDRNSGTIKRLYKYMYEYIIKGY